MTILKLGSWAAVIFWMAVIFSMSSQVAAESNLLSAGVTEGIVRIIERVVPAADLDFGGLNFIVRKAAHFLTYLVLGLLVLNALTVSGFFGVRAVALAIVICVLYAMSDEVHQLYVPGRSGEIRDVFIDSAGAVVGILGYWGLYKRG